jgi:hypothetical protein
MVKCFITVGIGAWTTNKTVKLVACPHVGDTIDVADHTILCERVHITLKEVYIEQTVHFQSEAQAKEYFK